MKRPVIDLALSIHGLRHNQSNFSRLALKAGGSPRILLAGPAGVAREYWTLDVERRP